MKLRNKWWLRALSMGLALGLMSIAGPGAALAATFSAQVTADRMPVYVNVNGKTKKATLPKGAVVTVGKVQNGVALIRYKGRYCLAQTKDMVALDAPQGVPAGASSERAVTKVATRAYQKPSTKSPYMKISAGTAVNVLAVKGNIAQVERGGVVAYMYRPHLTLESEAPSGGGESAPQGGGLPSVSEAFQSGKYSNEQLCFLFLTQVMGYNPAAAAGVLANINYESGFKTTLNGDGGSSYGLCQWHASRKTRLINYCGEHNVSPDSLLGQLAFLKYELETYYPKVNSYLKGVSNTPEGAYDAAYYFCYNFEAPAARESQSVKRGQSAQKTYYGRYGSL